MNDRDVGPEIQTRHGKNQEKAGKKKTNTGKGLGMAPVREHLPDIPSTQRLAA